MVKVITYGTYDLLHNGHIRLLERAKALGDYLIVGITSDDFDKGRGKINVQQSLMERIAAVKATGLADQIIVEEYEGQKIDDIKNYDVDIFTVGSDWVGKFDYLREYCDVVYLERTKGISSSQLRSEERTVRIGFIGDSEGKILRKYCRECGFVNGAEPVALCTDNMDLENALKDSLELVTDDYDELLDACDAVYIISHPSKHYEHVKKALLKKKHVLCESPVALDRKECEELFDIARKNHVVLMEALKTAYAVAYNRLVLLAKSGRIGEIVSVDATCTSLISMDTKDKNPDNIWNSICAWGPTAMLPIFNLLGTEYKSVDLNSLCFDKERKLDLFTKADFVYENAVASFKVGRGVKSEGELVVSGTEGYIYVPAPWWKTDYFEIRYENPQDNKRYFFQLDGEGIRNELVSFVRSVKSGNINSYIDEPVTAEISAVIGKFYSGEGNIL